MKFQPYIWELYKQSEQGKKAIDFFEYDSVFLNDVEVIQKYNPENAKWIDPRAYKNLMQEVADTIGEKNDYNHFKDFSDVRKYYENLLEEGIFWEDNQDRMYIFYPKDYQLFLEANSLISFLFYGIAYNFCYPHLFLYRFADLNKIADYFDIKLPPIPKKSDYKARCLYYMDLCEVFYNFRIENKLSPNELCAFLYDFAPNFIEKNTTSELPKPSQAWFIGGAIHPEEFSKENTLWQSNPETKKGDILVHYQTSPISAITHIWQSKMDGVKDPFFYYYANTYLQNPIEIPPITLKELQADEYFKNHSLVRKKFQGVNGWAMTNEDYSELLRILKNKNFDISTLPMPYAPDTPKGISVKNEKEVEDKLLEFYLSEMGFEKGKDYIKQLPIKAGRGSAIYPDYALHYNDSKGYETAKILIEAKFQMKSNKEIEEAFTQARSYANLLESSVIILCDKQMLLIYPKKESFDRNNYQKIYWEDLKNPDEFNKLKKILEK